MLDEVREIAELIAPKLTGKRYSELEFFQTMKEAENSQRFKVCQEAQRVRLLGIKRAKERGRSYHQMKWPELLQHCEIVMEELGYVRMPGEE